jgi:hypothetical protein
VSRQWTQRTTYGGVRREQSILVVGVAVTSIYVDGRPEWDRKSAEIIGTVPDTTEFRINRRPARTSHLHSFA